MPRIRRTDFPILVLMENDLRVAPTGASAISDARWIGWPIELWHRRGLSGQPKAFLCFSLSASEIEAQSEVFRVVGHSDEADIVLVPDGAALEGLRSVRSRAPDCLLPSVGLSKDLASACDCVFQVGDPDSWTALAETCRGFAQRRADLLPVLLSTQDASLRLLALLFVADRGLTLSAGTDIPPCEMGHSPAERMAAVLSLAEQGTLACDANGQEVAVHRLESGRRRLAHEAPSLLIAMAGSAGLALPAPGQALAIRAESAVAQAFSFGWHSPKIVEIGPDCAAASNLAVATFPTVGAAKAGAMPQPVMNQRRIEELHGLIGADQMARLRLRLLERIETTFAADAEPGTLAQQAHVMVALAGSLGFDALAEKCRLLEAAVMAGRHHRSCLDEARQEASHARYFLQQMPAAS